MNILSRDEQIDIIAALSEGMAQRAVSLYGPTTIGAALVEALSPDARHQTTPAMALGLTDHVWSVGELLDAALAVAPLAPTDKAPERRRRFRVIEGGKN